MTIKVQMNQRYADKALVAFSAVAAGLRIDWCLYAGTCLGLFRDGKYLPDDNDIDVAVRANPEQLEELWHWLDYYGFKLGKSSELADGTRNRHVYFHPTIRAPKEGGVLVDVFYAFPEEEENLLQWYDGLYYRDELYLTPHPVEEYLQLAYGEWWDKTKRNSAAGKEYARTL